MDTEKRKKILWVAIIIVFLLAFLLWVLRTSDKEPSINENTNIDIPVFIPPSAELKYRASGPIEETSAEFSASNLAKSYVARFGSWSTDNQGYNLNELLSLSTSKMKNYISNIELDFTERGFAGTTTKSLSAKIIDIDDSSAEILVNTQKIETNANLEKNVYYQEVQVLLININDKWLVDSLIWK